MRESNSLEACQSMKLANGNLMPPSGTVVCPKVSILLGKTSANITLGKPRGFVHMLLNVLQHVLVIRYSSAASGESGSRTRSQNKRSPSGSMTYNYFILCSVVHFLARQENVYKQSEPHSKTNSYIRSSVHSPGTTCLETSVLFYIRKPCP